MVGMRAGDRGGMVSDAERDKGRSRDGDRKGVKHS